MYGFYVHFYFYFPSRIIIFHHISLIQDKGSTMVCVFGLPPHAHENDPARGILCALQLRELLEPIKVTLSIGITSGIAYCGIVGSSQRCEYSVLGDTVNVSARLMQAAAGDIICDHETFLAARPEQSLAFRHLGEIQVKGKADWISIYLPAYVNYSSNAVKV
jgi:adenylate cyclase 10